jgi:peptidoglycan/xylan/chitin deacetylase (PgdA/CDA1 family)
MDYFRQLIKKTKLLFLESVYVKQLNIDIEKPIFSFTFDDAPLSSAKTGGRILEEANATGTYYVALGLQADKSAPEPLLDAEEIQSLHNKGHDIQCHTYGHLNLRWLSRKKYLPDCEMNRAYIRDITRQDNVLHFAYPFGSVGLSAKKCLGNIYSTLRTVDSGINYGLTDASHLRAIEIFSARLDKQKIREAINATVINNAWTIFFTHDVRLQPSPWGSTPGDFQWVVDECRKVDADILNITQAHQKITEYSG